MLETLALTVSGCLLGIGLLYLALLLAQPLLVSEFGLFISAMPLSPEMAVILGGVMVAATLLGIIPAMIAYRRTLRDGLTVKI